MLTLTDTGVLSSPKMLKFFSSHWNPWGSRILVTQKYINFLSHLDYSKIRLLKFLQFFKYIGIYIYLRLYGITASFASWAKFSKDFLTSPHGVAKLIHMPEFIYRWKTLEATQDFYHCFACFPKSQGSVHSPAASGTTQSLLSGSSKKLLKASLQSEKDGFMLTLD